MRGAPGIEHALSFSRSFYFRAFVVQHLTFTRAYAVFMKHLASLQDFLREIKENVRNPLNSISLRSQTPPPPQRVVVIDFTATGCGPCRMIAPAFETMVAEFPSVAFSKVDVDANQETAAHCGVRSMPTFQLFKGGEKVAETKGAREQELRVIILQPFITQHQSIDFLMQYVSLQLFALLLLIASHGDLCNEYK